MRTQGLHLFLSAQSGISHPNTDLDAQTFLLRLRQVRVEAGIHRSLPVSYQPQVSRAELGDSRLLVWDIGRQYNPALGNFDHHQEPSLPATPLLLLETLGREGSPLDLYVDQADRGHFFREPQPHPFAETLQGLGAGINLSYRSDQERSTHYQELLEWLEESGVDPYGRLDERLLPHRFHPFLEAKRAEERLAEREADRAEWGELPIGPIAYLESSFIGAMPSLYRRGAALVLLYDPSAKVPGWRRSAPKFTLGANPGLVQIPEQVDLRPLFDQLSDLEPRGVSWGGQAGIGGSPREEGGSGLTPDEVLTELEAFFG